MVEEEELLQFLEAYEVVTGIELGVVSSGERPDFVCAYPNAETIGIELSRSSHDYEMRTFDRIWSDRILTSHDLLTQSSVPSGSSRPSYYRQIGAQLRQSS